MANVVEDETWEEVDDELDEEVVVEGEEDEEKEQLPPGYCVADGPYKPFCTCADRITCSFCSWFHLIRSCRRHGKATKKPVKPCYCRKGLSEITKCHSTHLQLHKSVRSQQSEEFRQLDTCDCQKDLNFGRCNCLEDVVSSSSDSTWIVDRGPTREVTVQEVRGEDDFPDDEVDGSPSEEPEDDGSRLMNLHSREELSIQQECKQFRQCTCDEDPKPRSGSTTELESSTSGSSETDSSSQIEIKLFEDLEGSSDLSSSENSSAEGADMDWTRAQWYHYASDRSVESVSDDDYDDRQKRRAAVKKLQTRLFRSRRRRRGPKKLKTNPYQYLVVQESRKKNFLDVCKDKKNQPPSYSYHLMRII